jgi:hypothetical protein
MRTVVVGGSARNVGKTSLICGLISAMPECPWTVVKITSHDHGKTAPIWEETQAGQGTDTSRYLAAGARRALLVTAPDGNVPIAELRAAIADDRWLFFETNQIQSVHRPDGVLALIGPEETDSKSSFAAVVQRADALIYTGSYPGPTRHVDTRPTFVLPDLQDISPELIQWMRARLGFPALAR